MPRVEERVAALLAGWLLDEGIELAAPGIHQRHHPTEPLIHPGLHHRLAKPRLPGGEVLHLDLVDHGEERPTGVGEDAELGDHRAPGTLVADPSVELVEQGN